MIKAIRQQLYLSQESLAEYLGISRSQLAMAEALRRDLNSPANTKLLLLYNQFISKEVMKEMKTGSAVEKQTDEEIKRFIDMQVSQREYALTGAKRKLKKMVSQNKQALQTLAKTNIVKARSLIKDTSLLDDIEANAQRSFTATSPVEQLKLQLKIAGIEAELKFLNIRKKKIMG